MWVDDNIQIYFICPSSKGLIIIDPHSNQLLVGLIAQLVEQFAAASQSAQALSPIQVFSLINK